MKSSVRLLVFYVRPWFDGFMMLYYALRRHSVFISVHKTTIQKKAMSSLVSNGISIEFKRTPEAKKFIFPKKKSKMLFYVTGVSELTGMVIFSHLFSPF
jgi:hypothetical protein